jgi:hypothetical protein
MQPAGVMNVTMNYTAGTGNLYCTGGTCSASVQLPLSSKYSSSAAQVWLRRTCQNVQTSIDW